MLLHYNHALKIKNQALLKKQQELQDMVADNSVDLCLNMSIKEFKEDAGLVGWSSFDQLTNQGNPGLLQN